MPDDTLHSIEGLEIFKSGRWNGDHFSDADLQSIVDAYPSQGFRAPLKLGHSDKIGERAWGWITKVYKRGSVLLADVSDIPAELYRLIKQRAYDAISSEIFYNLERDGKKFHRCLKAVALLGSETPAVSDLRPIREVVHAMPAGRFLSFTTRFNMESSMHTEYTFANTGRIDSKLVQLARQYMTTTGEKNFEQAVTQVLADDPSLAVAYASFVSDPQR